MVNVKRWLLPLLAIVIGLPMTAMSQASGYSFSTSTGTYDTLVGGTSVSGVVADSYISSAIPIGFTFNFNGVNYTDVYASSNGFLSFNSSSSNGTANDLDNGSSSSSLMPLVAPLWDDLEGSSSSNSDALYQVTGTAPNRVFTFEWKRWEWTYSASDPVVSFQAKLYETSNLIEFVYQQEPTPPVSPGWGTISASIGIADGLTYLSVQDVSNPTVSSTVESDTITQRPATGDVYSFTPPSCIGSSGLGAYNIVADSASIYWDGTSQTQWEIEYGTTGFSLGSGTSSVVTNDTIEISGLSSLTQYEFYVRTICSIGDTSAWVGPFTFTSACGPVLPTYQQNFNGSWLPDCWSDASGGNATSGPSNMGSSDWDYNYYLNDWWTGTFSAYINLYSTGAQEWLISPEFDLSGGNYQLEYNFAITEYGYNTAEDMGSDDTVQVLITNDNGVTWDVLQTWTQGSNYSNTGSHQTLFLNAYSGDTVQIAFRATDGSVDDSEDYDVFIDDFEINTMPSCPTVSNIQEYGLSTTETYLTWTLGYMETQWQVQYDTNGFTLGNGTSFLASNDTVQITGLTSQTSYDFYVRGICGVGDTSSWAGPYTVNTPCGLFVPNYLEDFNSSSDWLPNCWVGAEGGSPSTGPTSYTNSGWYQENYINSSSNSSAATMNLYYTGSQYWLLSPQFDLSGGNFQLEFDFAITEYAYSTSEDMGSDDTVQVLVSNDFGSTWDVLETWVDGSSYSNTGSHQAYLLNTYAGDTVQFAIWGSEGSTDDSEDYEVFIDNFEVNSVNDDDLSAIAFVQPATLCGDSNTPIQVVVQNLGANAQTGFDVVVDWTGSTTGTISTTYTGTLNWNEFDTIAVDTLNTFFGGTFDLTAYTTLSGDQDINNDSVNSGAITILPGLNAPSVVGSTSQYACLGSSADIVAIGGGDTIVWYDAIGNVLTSGDTVSVTATSGIDTLYATAMYNSSPSCESSPVMVTLTPDTVAVDLGADTAYCSNEAFMVTLDAANAGSTYAWNTTETTQTISVDTAGSYSVEVTSVNGCIAADTLVVSENATPTVDLGADTAYCSDEAFALTLDAANAGSTFSWNTTETTQTISVDTAGDYSVVVTNVNGCSETDTLTVVENEAPSISVADAEFCEGESETLDAGSGFASYAWSSTETTQTIVVDASGTYEVTVTDANGCTGEATSTVVVNPLPVVDLGADTGVSPGQVIVLDAGNAGSTYNWNTGETTQTVDVEYADSPAEFSVVVTDANGCSAGDTIYVDQNTGIDELVNGSVKVYPNPTRSNATIAIDAVVSGELDVQMYSLTGQQIRNFKQDIYTGYQEVNVDMNNLESGVYFINATLNGKSLGQIRVLKVD